MAKTYKLIQGKTATEFERKVNSALASGYELHEGHALLGGIHTQVVTIDDGGDDPEGDPFQDYQVLREMRFDSLDRLQDTSYIGAGLVSRQVSGDLLVNSNFLFDILKGESVTVRISMPKALKSAFETSIHVDPPRVLVDNVWHSMSVSIHSDLAATSEPVTSVDGRKFLYLKVSNNTDHDYVTGGQYVTVDTLGINISYTIPNPYAGLFYS